MPGVSIHVVDVSRGVLAAGMQVELYAVAADGNKAFNGDVRISSRELSDVVAIAGLGTGGALRGVPVIGTVKMVSSNHAIELKPQQLNVGGSKIDGSLALAYPSGGPAIVTAELQVDSATIPGLLAVVVDRNARKGKLPSDHAPLFVDFA